MHTSSSRFAAGSHAAGLDASDVRDDTDLLGDGILDSLDVLELMAAVGDQYGIEGDWEDYDPEEILVVGPFCRYVERNMSDPLPGDHEPLERLRSERER